MAQQHSAAAGHIPAPGRPLFYLMVIAGGWALLQLHVPLVMIDEGGTPAALGEGQRQALAYLAIRLFPIGFGFALLFFAGFCVLLGVLILRSWLVPRVIGVLMIAAGVCYVVNTLAAILAPALSDLLIPWILLPFGVAELSLALWLVVKGVRVEVPERWESPASVVPTQAAAVSR